MTRFWFYLRLARPDQWVKNSFVLAPLIFSRELFDAEAFLTALRAFIGFCLAAGAVYGINDLADLAEDRGHPVKRLRPLASGDISRSEAVAVCAVFLAGAVIATLGLHWKFHLSLGVYVLMNLLYSVKLKEVVLLDVFLIASGFMLRVLGGAYVLDVPVSSWIVLCTMFISLFLGFAKRRGELVGSRADGPERKVLLLYSVGFIDQVLTIAAAGAVITYALYAVAPSTQAVFRTDKAIYTTVFVIYGVFRYLHLIHAQRPTENPTATLTADTTIIITGILWIASCIALIYFN